MTDRNFDSNCIPRYNVKMIKLNPENRQEMERYNAKLTEKKWREKWEKEETYLTEMIDKRKNIMF